MKAALILLALSAVFGLCAPSASSGSGVQEIRLIQVRTSNHPDRKRSSWTSNLVNEIPQFGRPVGSKVGGEVGFSHGAHYVGAIKLPGGVLEYSGRAKHLPRNAGTVIPVVGGSGAFSGVTGTYTLYRGDKFHPTASVLVLRLQYA